MHTKISDSLVSKLLKLTHQKCFSYDYKSASQHFIDKSQGCCFFADFAGVDEEYIDQKL